MKLASLVLFLLVFSTVTAQDKVPSVSLKTLQGKNVNIKTLSKDKGIVVLSLWATWCVPCINELDAINDEYEDIKSEVDFELLAISIDDARSVKLVKPLVNGKGWEFDVLLDTNNDLKRMLGVATVPATVIIKDGKIVKKYSGYKPGAEEELFDYLRKL